MTPITSVEWLTFQPASQRGQAMLQALLKAAPATVKVRATTAYRGESDLLMLWGPGHPSRALPMQAQAARGHTIAFDGAYWSRDKKVRCSIDHAHPQRWVMKRDWPAARFAHDAPFMARRFDPAGPVIIAGLGVKAKVQYGAQVIADWEAGLAGWCQARGRRVLYRRKCGMGNPPAGVRLAPDGPIETVLDGASLLATWHSNVAIDAIRMGIPVICRDGAARAVCPSQLPATSWPVPLPGDVRDRFLWNLAWFQWAPHEARAFWAWLPEILSVDGDGPVTTRSR
jgi:hypothetical protein